MNPQDKNAGNIGDLLKHFWLLELLSKVTRKSPRKIAYLESHAGAGLYYINQSRIRSITRNRQRVCHDVKRWEVFDNLQADLGRGLYRGSFTQVFGLLRQISGLTVKGKLWEKDDEANRRIWKNRDTLIPFDRSDVIVRKKESNPKSFARSCRRFQKDGYTVIWLCDPFWGSNKAHDRGWTELISLDGTYGVLFAYCAGNSQKRGTAKFDYAKVTGLDRTTDRRIDDGIRSYALYFTPTSRSLLGAGPSSG